MSWPGRQEKGRRSRETEEDKGRYLSYTIRSQCGRRQKPLASEMSSQRNMSQKRSITDSALTGCAIKSSGIQVTLRLVFEWSAITLQPTSSLY